MQFLNSDHPAPRLMQATSADNLNDELESGPEKVKIRLQAPGKPEMVATLVVNQPLKAAVDFYAQQHLSHAEQLLGIQHVKVCFTSSFLLQMQSRLGSPPVSFTFVFLSPISLSSTLRCTLWV